jgi:hypothetical protein
MITLQAVLEKTATLPDQTPLKLMQTSELLAFGENGDTRNVEVLHILHGVVSLEVGEPDKDTDTLGKLRSLKEYVPTGNEPLQFDDYDFADEPSYVVTCQDVKVLEKTVLLLY